MASYSIISTTATDGTGTGLTVNLNISWDIYYNYTASWSVVSPGDGYKVGDTITIGRPGGGLPDAKIFPNGITTQVTGISTAENTAILENNINGLDAIADYVQIPGMETKSHQEGPEHSICYVNELINPMSNLATYRDLALGGIRINSAKEFTDFTQFSAYFKNGIKVTDLSKSIPWDSTTNYSLDDIVLYKGKSYKATQSSVNQSPSETSGFWDIYKKASNNFAEIAYALLTDSNLGAGKLIGINAVGDMTKAAKFCEANRFTWDGVVSNKINLRDFLYEYGTYNLLDFTVIGGKFNLLPAVPYDSDYKIEHGKKIDVSALFTDGNIKDLKVSFLSPEERQLFRANVLWRRETANAFAETKSLMVRLINDQGGSPTDPIESWDLSGFCTTKEAAITFARYSLKVRKEVDHGLSFKTAPQYCVNLSPGDYFRLVSEATHVDRYSNGVITAEGKVISKDEVTGTKDIYYWEPGTTVEKVKEANNVNFTTGVGLPLGVLFTIKNSVTSNRVYKVETISYADDGLIEISGSHAPLTSTGSLSILDGWDKTEPFKHFEEIT